MSFELRHFIINGYCRIENVLNETFKKRLRADAIARVVARSEANDQALPMLIDNVAGTLAVDVANTLHNALIAYGAVLLRDRLCLPDIRYIAGAIIPKYQNEHRRPWHVDWWRWDASETRSFIPPQVGVIFYIDPAKYEDGQLVVVPHSHFYPAYKWKTSLTDERSFSRTDEQSVAAFAGDAIVIDARLMHATTARHTSGTRIAITMWYMVDWANLSEQIRCDAMLNISPDMEKYLCSLYPSYDGYLKPSGPVTYPQFRIE